MTRTTVPLTLDRLEELAAPCRSCLWWEGDPVTSRGWGADLRIAEKEAWISAVLREWGSCGRVLLLDSRPVGYLSYAPASFVPAAGRFPTAPVSTDAVLLTAVWVQPAHRGAGLGRVLVQAMARDLIGRDGVRAVEAFARRRSPGEGSCLVEAEFLARVGFRTHRPHPVTPRMRMEMKSLLTWREDLHAVWGRLVGVVRPPLPATPSSLTTQTAGPPAGGPAVDAVLVT